MLHEIELSTQNIVWLLTGVIFFTVSLIVYFRLRFNSYFSMDRQKTNFIYDGETSKFLTKYKEIDVFRFSGSFFNYGLAVAMAVSLGAISWTTYEKSTKFDITALEINDEVEIEIPRIPEPPSPPPPPPPPTIQEVPDNEVIDDEQPDFESYDINEDTPIEIPPVFEKKASPPPPPPPPAPVEDEFIIIAEQMPRFPGCEDKKTDKEKEVCSKTKMLEYIYKNLKYPAIARETGVEGQVVIQFVVDKDGSIDNIKIIRDIGAGCGAESEKVVNGMNSMGQKWIPGRQGGRPVRVLYTLPVKFKLER